MTNPDSLMAMTVAARATVLDPERIALVGGGANPRFELFHAASSLCSQKVRAVLHEKALPYRSNDMRILGTLGEHGLVPAEHYAPAYVRLRLVAARELGIGYVSGYSGRTSVRTEGFDPCVVPLLVDHEAGRVIADSRRICVYLDAVSRGPVQLVPDEPERRAEAMRQVDIVDRLPNGALLYGFHPDADLRPEPLKAAMRTVYDHKIMALEALIAAHPAEPELVAAWRAKIAKESGGRRLCRDPGFQRAARDRTAQLLPGPCLLAGRPAVGRESRAPVLPRPGLDVAGTARGEGLRRGALAASVAVPRGDRGLGGLDAALALPGRPRGLSRRGPGLTPTTARHARRPDLLPP